MAVIAAQYSKCRNLQILYCWSNGFKLSINVSLKTNHFVHTSCVYPSLFPQNTHIPLKSNTFTSRKLQNLMLLKSPSVHFSPAEVQGILKYILIANRVRFSLPQQTHKLLSIIFKSLLFNLMIIFPAEM